MIDKYAPKTYTKDDLMKSTSKGKDRINAVKYHLRRAVYFPFQLLIVLCYLPFIWAAFAATYAESLAFEYTYMTADNPRVNQIGPTRTRMKKHCFLTRFIFPWL